MPGLTFRSDQNAQNSGTTIDLTEPVGLAVGDFVMLPAVWKRATNTTVATPTNWAATTDYTVGTGAEGAGTGPLKVKAFHRVVDSVTLPNLTISGTGASQLNAGSIVWIPDTGWTAEVSSTAGSDTTETTDFTATGSAVLPFVTDDWLVLCCALTNVTPTFTANGATISIAGATFNAFDSKWESAPTTGDDLRHHTYTARCTAGTATAVPSLTLTTSQATGSTGGMVFYRVHPVHLPWHVLGIDGTSTGNHFKLQAARNGEGAVFEKTRAEIAAGYYEDPYFFSVGADQSWVQFWVRLDSATTAGSSYARSELREMAADGTTNAAWNTASGTHRLRARMRVTHLPPVKPTVVFAQIHDGGSDVLQLVTELNSTTGLVEVKCRINGTSSGQPKLKLDYQIGDIHEFMVEVVDGVTKVYWDDLYQPVITTTAVSTTTAYFKAGCYSQSNETIDSPTEWMSVDLQNLRAWHTGQAGDTGAPPPVFSPPLPRARSRHLLVR